MLVPRARARQGRAGREAEPPHGVLDGLAWLSRDRCVATQRKRRRGAPASGRAAL